MKIDARYSETKIYSRFKYENELPLLAEDLHGEADILENKIKTILDVTLGSGVLETPTIEKDIVGSNSRFRVSSPFPINVKGEIFLVGSSESMYPVTVPNTFTGTLVVICWLSKISQSTSNYEYGCLRNKAIADNGLYNANLKLQPSTRYQVRYDIVPITNQLKYNAPKKQNITFTDAITDAGTKTFTVPRSSFSLVNKVYEANSTSNIPSENGKFFMIPIANVTNGIAKSIDIPRNALSVSTSNEPTNVKDGLVWFNPDTEESKLYYNNNWRNLGGVSVVKSPNQPTTPLEGLIWYNTNTKEFKLYIGTEGFISLNNLLSFVQLLGSFVITTPAKDSNTTITIPIANYSSNDLLSVYYEGAVLTKDVHFTLNASNKTITLQNFTTNVGDVIQFNATKILNSNLDVDAINVLSSHVSLTSSNLIKGHCNLSDTTDGETLSVNSGIAATPKAVNDVKKLVNRFVDSSTGKVYQIKVVDGNINLEEI